MHSPFELPLLRAVTTPPDTVSADVSVALYAGEPADTFRSRLPAAARSEFDAALTRGEPLADAGHVLVAGAAGGGRCLIVGAGAGALTPGRQHHGDDGGQPQIERREGR